MADYAAAFLTVFACPDEHRDEVFEMIVDVFDSIDDVEPISERDAVELGVNYTGDSVNMAEPFSLAQKFSELGVAFHIGQSAKYEYTAWTFMGVPGVGELSGQASDEGCLLIDTDAVDVAARLRGGTPDDFVAVWAEMTKPEVRGAVRDAYAARDMFAWLLPPAQLATAAA